MKIPFFHRKQTTPSDTNADSSAKTKAPNNKDGAIGEIQTDKQKGANATEQPSTRCDQPSDDLRAPPAPATLRITVDNPIGDRVQAPRINMAYHYDDNDILSLLTTALKPHIETGGVQVGTPAEDLERVFADISLWHDQRSAADNDDRPALLIVPYSPVLADGTPCNHWSVLVLSQHGTEAPLNIAYVDPIEATSEVPSTLQAIVEHTFTSEAHAETTDGKKDGNPAQATPIIPHQIQHTAQQDAASCGPRIVEDAIELAEFFMQRQQLPTELTNATQRSAEAIRATHIAQLGGLQSPFGQKQHQWQPAYQPLTQASASIQNTFRADLLDLFSQVSPQEHKALVANPCLETLEQLGVTVPKAYEPSRPWANRFMANYEKIHAHQAAFIEALTACEKDYPGLFQTLSDTWCNTQEGFPVLKIIRGDMAGLIKEGAAEGWQSPEANVLTQLSKAFFKNLELHPDTTIDALEAAEFEDMELLEWAFSAVFTKELEREASDHSAENTANNSATDTNTNTTDEDRVAGKRDRSPSRQDSFEDLYGLYS